MQGERALDMTHPDTGSIHQHADHVEPIRLLRPSVTGHPHPGRPAQLLLLPPVDCPNRVSEQDSPPSLDLDERDQSGLCHDEVDVPMTASKPAMHHPPTPLPKPPLRDSLSKFAECLPDR